MKRLDVAAHTLGVGRTGEIKVKTYKRRICVPITEHRRQFAAYCLRREWKFAYTGDGHFEIDAGIRDQELPSGIWRPA